MRAPELDELEQSLTRIAGITAATVGGSDSLTEIHVVAVPGRAPKQIVRDIQSLAQAGYGLEVDHRNVSIVQLESPVYLSGGRTTEAGELAEENAMTGPEATSIPSAGEHRGRPILEQVIFGRKGATSWAKVALRWPDGNVTEGISSSGESRTVRAHAAGAAFLTAVEPHLTSRKAKLEVEQVLLHRVNSHEMVVVNVAFSEHGTVTPLIGTAIIHDDVATATVHALLHASNRKLVTVGS
jgi:hypothetical protein